MSTGSSKVPADEQVDLPQLARAPSADALLVAVAGAGIAGPVRGAAGVRVQSEIRLPEVDRDVLHIGRARVGGRGVLSGIAAIADVVGRRRGRRRRTPRARGH